MFSLFAQCVEVQMFERSRLGTCSEPAPFAFHAHLACEQKGHGREADFGRQENARERLLSVAVSLAAAGGMMPGVCAVACVFVFWGKKQFFFLLIVFFLCKFISL